MVSVSSFQVGWGQGNCPDSRGARVFATRMPPKVLTLVVWIYFVQRLLLSSRSSHPPPPYPLLPTPSTFSQTHLQVEHHQAPLSSHSVTEDLLSPTGLSVPMSRLSMDVTVILTTSRLTLTRTKRQTRIPVPISISPKTLFSSSRPSDCIFFKKRTSDHDKPSSSLRALPCVVCKAERFEPQNGARLLEPPESGI